MKTLRGADRMAREYARVLHVLDPGERDAVREHFMLLHKEAGRQEDLRNFLEHPAVSQDEKLSSVETLAPRGFSPLVGRVIADVIKRRITFLFSAIAEEMQRLSDEADHIRPVKVTSAAPLSERQRDELSARLQAYCGGRVRARFEVDASLMAGLSIQTADTVLDNSLRNGLEHIRRELAVVSST